ANGLVLRRALALIVPRRKRTRLLKPVLAPNFLASFGVFGRSVIRGDNVLARDADASQRRRLQRERLRGRVPFPGCAPLRHWTFFHAEDRLARHAIEDEHVP